MKKDSPQIMFIAGIGGVVVSALLACRATLKLEDTLEEFKEEIDGVKSLQHHDATKTNYPTNEYGKDLTYVYLKNTAKLVKLYAPSVIIGGVSVGLLTGSHVTLNRRNAGLTAAYSALQVGFDEYRERVKEEIGEEKELDAYRGTSVQKIEVDGKMLEERVVDPNRWSPYAKMFDADNINWHKNAEINRLFIQAQQNYFNDLLIARGHVFLNEVYDHLGFEHTKAGSVVGWVINDTGDNFVDFGMFEAHSSRFVNGWERSIILDFNVDGVIYDKI
jgi:hypothetical protein